MTYLECGIISQLINCRDIRFGKVFWFLLLRILDVHNLPLFKTLLNGRVSEFVMI